MFSNRKTDDPLILIPVKKRNRNAVGLISKVDLRDRMLEFRIKHISIEWGKQRALVKQ